MDFKVALGMEAYGADLGSFSAYADMSAVTAFPHCDTALAEYFVSLNIAQQRTIAFLMVLFNRGHPTELFGQGVEALLIGIPDKTVIHVGPFVVLTFSRMEKVDSRVSAHSAESLTPQFCMLLLIVGSLKEECRNLLETVFTCHGSEIGVFVTRHALAGKRLLKIFFGLSSGILIGGPVGHTVGNLNFLKIRCRMLADGTDETVGQLVADIFVATHLAAPHGVAVLHVG